MSASLKKFIFSPFLFYKSILRSIYKPLSSEEWEVLKMDFETNLLIGNCKLASYFPRDKSYL